MCPLQIFRDSRSERFVIPVFLALSFCSPLFAQQGAEGAVVDQQTLQLLLKKIDQLEVRVNQLEADRQNAGACNLNASPKSADPPMSKAAVGETQSAQGASEIVAALQAATTTPPTTAPIPPPPAHDQAQSENVMTERMDLSKTLLRIRGFGDISLHGDTQKGDTTSFSLGQLDLFVTSDVSEKFKFLSEIVFEGGPDDYYGVPAGPANSFSVDVERYLLQYSYNDYLKLSVGRGHTAIGYYNTAFHHSTWLQTTTDRPFLFEFEDRGGILPIHIVGASASGMVPSGSLGLHYVAEIGNGRESVNPLVDEPVQNEIDDQNHKAFNLALFARPEGIRGLQTGFSIYRDLIAPLDEPRIGETILAAHAVFVRPKFEWLNEALVVRHAPIGSATVFHIPGFYSQISRQFGAYRPYLRYEYLNAPNNEPVFPEIGLRAGPLAGVRYDASESVALKFQYNYTFLRNQPGVNGLTTQVGFTF
jgi:hypothetical protein